MGGRKLDENAMAFTSASTKNKIATRGGHTERALALKLCAHARGARFRPPIYLTGDVLGIYSLAWGKSKSGLLENQELRSI